MLKTSFKFVAIAAICLLCNNATAQTDTSHYDLGRITLKKEFTQSVTVKGEDLEKIPSTTLSDAIAVWFSGSFTRTYGVVYIVDGDLINDVNAYSIFDIEEVTLIQNATAAINGTTQQQNLVLIKTRKNRKAKSGLTVAGQTNLANVRNSPGTDATYYHQYYISAYKNTDVSHFGLSADYQRDVLLGTFLTATSINSAKQTLDRYKLYGYFETKLGSNSTIGVSANYVPESGDYSSSGIVFNPSTPITQTQNQHLSPGLLNTKLSFNSNLGTGLTNSFSFNYNNVNSTINSSTQLIQTGNNLFETSKQTNASNIFLVRDNIQYQHQFGNWSFEPAANFSFRYSKENQGVTATYKGSGIDSLLSGAFLRNEYKVWLLTPSVSLSYKNIFNVQAGVVVSLKTNDATGSDKKLSPYVTASVDVLRATHASDSYSWKLFGSYTNSGNYYDTSSQLPDLNTNNNNTVNSGSYSTIVIATPDLYHSFNNYQAGTVFSMLNKRLSFAYNFEDRQFTSLVTEYTSGTGYLFYIYPLTTSTLNHLSVTANLLNSKAVQWTSSINGTRIGNKYDFSHYPGIGQSVLLTSNKGWTGGWVNQLEYNKVIFGADVLYYINEANGFNGPVTTNHNSFVLQNVYLGYRITANHFKTFDVYANIRNLVQNSTADITDNRKFYGLGFKAGF